MAQVAVRSQFTTGNVTVSANVAGLPNPSGSVSYAITPVLDIVRTDTVLLPASG